MGQIRGKGLKFAAVILAIALIVGMTPQNATKANGEEKDITITVSENSSLHQETMTQPDVTSPAALSMAQAASSSLPANILPPPAVGSIPISTAEELAAIGADRSSMSKSYHIKTSGLIELANR